MAKMSNTTRAQEQLLHSLLFFLKVDFDKDRLINFTFDLAEDMEWGITKEEFAEAFSQLKQNGKLENKLTEIDEHIEFIANMQ